MTAVVAASAVAQVRTAQSAASGQIQARHEISVVESVLENAVRYGAQMLSQHLQASNAPDMVMLSGVARARGFRIDGYGVVFDVEFPSIRRSVMWSMRALQRPDPELVAALQELRKNMQSVTDPRARQELDRAIRDFEAHMRAVDAQAGAQPPTPDRQNPGAVAASSAGIRTNSEAVSADPLGIYFSEITTALVDALLDHGAPVGLGNDEWLTVAARESADRRFAPDDPSDTAMTIILRIKGSDLNALRDRRLSREDARKRVEVKQY